MRAVVFLAPQASQFNEMPKLLRSSDSISVGNSEYSNVLALDH